MTNDKPTREKLVEAITKLVEAITKLLEEMRTKGELFPPPYTIVVHEDVAAAERGEIKVTIRVPATWVERYPDMFRKDDEA